MNRDTKIQKLREAIAAQTVAYPTISQAEEIYEAVFGEPEWEYSQSEVLDDGTVAFGNAVETIEEAIRRRDMDRINYPWPEELGIGRRIKAGEWEEVSS